MSTDPLGLVRLAVQDLLERSGYWGSDAGLDDLTAALVEAKG